MLLVLAMASVHPAYGEDCANHERTSAPSDSRYELVQSPLAARTTLKLDKWTGATYIVVEDQSGAVSWQVMTRAAPDPVPGGNKANYQIFTSAIAARFTYLLNVSTGATWLLVEDSTTGELLWAPMP